MLPHYLVRIVATGNYHVHKMSGIKDSICHVRLNHLEIVVEKDVRIIYLCERLCENHSIERIRLPIRL